MFSKLVNCLWALKDIFNEALGDSSLSDLQRDLIRESYNSLIGVRDAWFFERDYILAKARGRALGYLNFLKEANNR
mgnify:CR=1 FL=1